LSLCVSRRFISDPRVGPVLAAILIAGRSGLRTPQIGVMRRD
jgi:ABC-type transporter Mla maintaining outer membrane lipid asymmetry permease subunit MlaE